MVLLLFPLQIQLSVGDPSESQHIDDLNLTTRHRIQNQTTGSIMALYEVWKCILKCQAKKRKETAN